MAAYLLKQGADPNIRDMEGLTMLMRAANLNKTEWVRLLLAHGVRPETTTDDGDTALHYAAREDCGDTIRLLLSDKRVNKLVTTPNEEGLTPVSLAITHGRWENLNLLLAALTPADATGYAYDNISAQEVAQAFGHKSTANLIKKENLRKGFRPTMCGLSAQEMTEKINRCK